MSAIHHRQPGACLIFVHRDPDWRASIARYGGSAQGSLMIEFALNADALEPDAWAAVKAMGWQESDADQPPQEIACPPELAARAEFGSQASMLDGYRAFLASVLREMPDPQPETRLKPALALERMRCLPSGGDWTRRDHPSDVVMMHEYLRRAAVWAQALNLADAWPFFSITAKALPNLPRPDGLFQEWKAHEAAMQGHFEFWTQWAISCYMHWSSGAKELRAFELPAPYEPLIRLLERGGAFRRDPAGFVEVGGSTLGYRMVSIAEYASLPAWMWLDEGSLDWLDRVALHHGV